jgi:hypothetical protein
MENSIADVQLAREGSTATIDPLYAPPALTTPAAFAVSTSVKVAIVLAILVWMLTKDPKLTAIVVGAQMILHALLK